MLRGLYTAAAGMITQQRKHDTITNNISNLNTPGYKQETAVSRSFPEMLISAMGAGTNGGSIANIGKLNTGVMAEEDLTIYQQGDLQETKNPFDLALVTSITKDPSGKALPPFDRSGKYVAADGTKVFQPQAFFTVLNDAGEQRYSRNGKFVVNEAGQLTTPEGYKVLGADGKPIVLSEPDPTAADPNHQTPVSQVKIGLDGSLLDAVSGKPLNTSLMISRVENPNRMVLEGNGVYRVNPEDAGSVSQAVVDDQIQVHQGYIERSNVDPTQSMVDLMAAQRAYEANQKMVQYYDRSLDKAVNEIGRV